MDNKRELPFGKFKIPYVTNVEFYSRIGGQVGRLLQKCFVIARKNQGFGI